MVDQAIGVLLAVGRLTPDEGWNVLREVSQRKNIKLHHLAELIIGWARTRSLCDEVRAETRPAVGAARPSAGHRRLSGRCHGSRGARPLPASRGIQGQPPTWMPGRRSGSGSLLRMISRVTGAVSPRPRRK
ncbi:ANTAR domain-containing protein [Streptomyces sp. NPDC091879]|uniref:ANTAR domain-containing protein n=1 Tax=Streptomyces sp. NPDC091879 TaxID=3366006 RepID=UPI003815EE8A